MKIFYGRGQDLKITYELKEESLKTVFSTFTVSDDQDIADVLDYLRTVVCQPVPSMPNFSWDCDQTYRTADGRAEMRAAIKLPAKEEKKEEKKVVPVAYTLCTCGHETPGGLRMTTSSGTSCPNCYDRMEGA